MADDVVLQLSCLISSLIALLKINVTFDNLQLAFLPQNHFNRCATALESVQIASEANLLWKTLAPESNHDSHRLLFLLLVQRRNKYLDHDFKNFFFFLTSHNLSLSRLFLLTWTSSAILDTPQTPTHSAHTSV